MMVISDSGYHELANTVYNVEPRKAESNDEPVIVKAGNVYDKITDQTYQVLLTQDNSAPASPRPNGMQAMAVA